MLRRIVITAGALLLAATATWATSPRAALLQSVLAAAGAEEAQLATRTRSLEHEIRILTERLGDRPPSYRHARRLHDVLHTEYLRRYDDDADDIQQILVRGRYNCLSAVLFYGVVARSLGYETSVLGSPGHLQLRISFGNRTVDVETTSPDGFDIHVSTLDHDDERGSDGRPHGHRYLHRRDGREYWEVTLEQAVGFAWLNAAWRAYDAGSAVRAADGVKRAGTYLPGLVERAEGARRLLARAFQFEYEAGRFDNAYRIASIDVELYPSMTTSRDRFLAAALKRIEEACDTDRPGFAATIMGEVAATCPPGTDVERLERRARPLIAAASVRIHDWPLALRSAARYAEIEPDGVESFRLLAWVEERSLEPLDPVADDVCALEAPR